MFVRLTRNWPSGGCLVNPFVGVQSLQNSNTLPYLSRRIFVWVVEMVSILFPVLPSYYSANWPHHIHHFPGAAGPVQGCKGSLRPAPSPPAAGMDPGCYGTVDWDLLWYNDILYDIRWYYIHPHLKVDQNNIWAESIDCWVDNVEKKHKKQQQIL